MLVNSAESGIISRGFNSAATTRLSSRSNWTRSSQMNKAFTGMRTRAFGIPVMGIAQRGDNWCPPERDGAAQSTGLIAGTGALVAPMTGKGWISKNITNLGDVTYCNLAGGINIEALIDDAIGEIDAPLTGPALLNALISIGSIPSADDVALSLMDTPIGAIEDTMTLREALKVILAVVAGKTTIDDLGDGLATVKFRNVGDTKDVVTAEMTESERTTVTLDKS